MPRGAAPTPQQIDVALLEALGKGGWHTADALAAPLRSRYVDASVIGARLRSLRARDLVKHREAPNGITLEWAAI